MWFAHHQGQFWSVYLTPKKNLASFNNYFLLPPMQSLKGWSVSLSGPYWFSIVNFHLTRVTECVDLVVTFPSLSLMLVWFIQILACVSISLLSSGSCRLMCTWTSAMFLPLCSSKYCFYEDLPTYFCGHIFVSLGVESLTVW